MKNIITGFIIYVFVLIPFISFSQSNDNPNKNKITPNDIEVLIGSWEGSLTYIDYSTGKPFKMPANLKVEEGKNIYQLKLNYLYPNEPKANNISKLLISKDGKKIDGKEILSRKINENNEIEFIAEYPGKDGNENKKAIIRKIHVLGKSSFVIRKEVKFLEKNEWIIRNEYRFIKK